VRLTFGLGGVDKIGFGETLRLRDHRAGHRDVVVVGKLAHQFAGRVGDRRQRAGHFGPRLGLDFGDEAAQHVVEQADVIFVERRRAIHEQIGDAPHCLGTPGV
jgi:hypothetical protein